VEIKLTQNTERASTTNHLASICSRSEITKSTCVHFVFCFFLVFVFFMEKKKYMKEPEQIGNISNYFLRLKYLFLFLFFSLTSQVIFFISQ